jgi:hypothetical protein
MAGACGMFVALYRHLHRNKKNQVLDTESQAILLIQVFIDELSQMSQRLVGNYKFRRRDTHQVVFRHDRSRLDDAVS